MAALLSFGCSRADAETYDSSDPVYCMTIFGIAANAANEMSNADLANEVTMRLFYLASQHGGVEWIRKITPDTIQAAARMEAAHDETATIKLLTDCEARQDADPGFRRFVEQNKR